MKRQYIVYKQNNSFYSPQKSRNKKLLKYFFLFTLAIVISMVLIPPVKTVLANLFIGLTPIYIGLFIVYLLKEPRKWLAKNALKPLFTKSQNAYKKRMDLALIIVFLLFIALIVGIFMLFIPKFLSIIEDIVKNTDAYAQKIKLELTTFLSHMPYISKINVDDYVNENVDKLVEYLKSFTPRLANILADFASSVLKFIGILIIGLFFSFLLLLNIDKYKKSIKEYAKRHSSPLRFRKLQNFAVESDRILIDYGYSKLIEGIIIFVAVLIGLLICKTPMPVELSLFMAIFNVIAYIGPIIALVPIIIFSLVLSTANVALISALVSVLIVIIVTSFITPLIVGRKIKIDTATVIISLTIGGAIFGAIGLILAPPVSAILLKLRKNY